MMVLDHWDAEQAVWVDHAGSVHVFGAHDLVAMADVGRNRASHQRVPGFLRARGALTACTPVDDGWHVQFADGSFVTVSAATLAAAATPADPMPDRVIWTASDPAMPVHDHDAVMHDDAALLACLRQVWTHGYARIGGARVEPGTVLEFLARFGPVRETNYGRLFDVRVRPDPANLADSALALLPHSDNPYRDSPPDLQVLHALNVPATGGETWLVDGAAVVRHLRAVAPDALALLTQVPVRFVWADADWHLETTPPALTLDADGALVRLRVNSRSLDRPVEPDPARRAAWWQAWHMLESCLAAPSFAQTFALKTGEMVLMDNTRVLHGRTAFAGAAAARHLQGAYADRDGLRSTVIRLARARAQADVAELGALFASDAMGEHYGEHITIRDHMLQSAEVAMQRKLDARMIAAALLHDIGWTLAAPHEQSGAQLLEPVFGPGVAGPVRGHVAAKRFLVAQDAAYFSRLSPASVATLQQQGGPMDAAECAAFAAQPGHADAVALRLIDDAGKDLAPPQSHWDDYAPLLLRLALRHRLNAQPA